MFMNDINLSKRTRNSTRTRTSRARTGRVPTRIPVSELQTSSKTREPFWTPTRLPRDSTTLWIQWISTTTSPSQQASVPLPSSRSVCPIRAISLNSIRTRSPPNRSTQCDRERGREGERGRTREGPTAARARVPCPQSRGLQLSPGTCCSWTSRAATFLSERTRRSTFSRSRNRPSLLQTFNTVHLLQLQPHRGSSRTSARLLDSSTPTTRPLPTPFPPSPTPSTPSTPWTPWPVRSRRSSTRNSLCSLSSLQAQSCLQTTPPSQKGHLRNTTHRSPKVLSIVSNRIPRKRNAVFIQHVWNEMKRGNEMERRSVAVFSGSPSRSKEPVGERTGPALPVSRAQISPRAQLV